MLSEYASDLAESIEGFFLGRRHPDDAVEDFSTVTLPGKFVVLDWGENDRSSAEAESGESIIRPPPQPPIPPRDVAEDGLSEKGSWPSSILALGFSMKLKSKRFESPGTRGREL